MPVAACNEFLCPLRILNKMASLYVNANNLDASSKGIPPPEHVCLEHGTVTPLRRSLILHSNIKTLVVLMHVEFSKPGRFSEQDAGASDF